MEPVTQTVGTMLGLPSDVLGPLLYFFGSTLMAAVGVTVWVTVRVTRMVSYPALQKIQQEQDQIFNDKIKAVQEANVQVHDRMANSFQHAMISTTEKVKDILSQQTKLSSSYLKTVTEELQHLRTGQEKMGSDLNQVKGAMKAKGFSFE